MRKKKTEERKAFNDANKLQNLRSFPVSTKIIRDACRLETHPFADDEAHAGSSPVRELDQRHQVLVVHHRIWRFMEKTNTQFGWLASIYLVRQTGEQFCPLLLNTRILEFKAAEHSVVYKQKSRPVCRTWLRRHRMSVGVM